VLTVEFPLNVFKWKDKLNEKRTGRDPQSFPLGFGGNGLSDEASEGKTHQHGRQTCDHPASPFIAPNQW